MAAKRRVRFLQYFNGYRMLIFLESDTVGVLFSVFFLVYIIMTNAAASISMIVIFSFGISVGTSILYAKTKKSASKGFLRHWFYVHGIYSVKEDINKFEEVSRLDVTNYIPNNNDMIFSD